MTAQMDKPEPPELDTGSTKDTYKFGSPWSPKVQMIRAKKFLRSMIADYEAVAGHTAPDCDLSVAMSFHAQERIDHPFLKSSWSPWYDMDEDRRRQKSVKDAVAHSHSMGFAPLIIMPKEARGDYRRHKAQQGLEKQALLIAVAKEKIKKCEADVALLRGDGSIDTPEQERYDESPGSMDLPVIRAIYSGDPNTVHKLLAQGLDVNSVILDRAGRDRTALYFATKKGSITIVQLLLDHGAACADFALHEAVIRDRVDIVKLCIAHGANIHTPNPLWDYFAVLKHVKSIEMAKVFIEAGQTQDEINAGLSTFCDHIHEESLEIVEFLLQHGAQFNGPDYFPLVKFLRREHVNVVRLLLEKGADVYEWDKYGGYLCEAVKSGGNEDAVRLLLNYKANVNVLERDGTSALILAAGCSFDGIVSLLLDHGADIENRTKNGVRALHAATRAGDLETVLILLQRGAAPNVQMSDGQTPLHIAAKTGQIAMTVLLLENGADPKLVDSEGMTAQQLASKSCQPGTEGILQKATGDSTAQENSQSLRTAGDDGRSKASSSKGTSESHDHQIPKTRNPRFFKRIFRRHKEEKDSGSGDRSD